MAILKSNVVLTQKTYKNILIFSCMALFCMLIAILGPPLVDQLLDDQINKMLVVDSPSASGYEDWQTNVKDDGIPIWFKFWMFNLTNVEEVIAGTAKPKFDEIGPYCYKELRSKINITWTDDGDQVTYWSYKYFTFDPDCTAEGLSEDDMYITANTGMMTFLNNIANPDLGKDFWLNDLLWDTMALIFNEPLYVNVTAKEAVFGYDDPILSYLHDNLDESIPSQVYIQLNLTNEQETYKLTKFTTQNTGKKDIDNIANYIYWNGEDHLDCWGSDWANEIYGTDGNNWPPKVKKDDVLVAFVDTAYRRGKFIYQKESSYESIDCYRYILDPKELLNVTNEPDNWQWYALGYNGLINTTKCVLGCPIFLSKANFLDCDQEVVDMVEGVVPDRSQHDTFADIEPRTGYTMNIYKRIQINLLLRPVFMTYENISSVYFPLTWIEESGYITHSLAKDFRHTVYTVEDSEEVMGWLGAFLAILFGAMAVALIIAVIVTRRRLVRASREQEGLINTVEPSSM